MAESSDSTSSVDDLQLSCSSSSYECGQSDLEPGPVMKPYMSCSSILSTGWLTVLKLEMRLNQTTQVHILGKHLLMRPNFINMHGCGCQNDHLNALRKRKCSFSIQNGVLKKVRQTPTQVNAQLR
jgi:hypothetical protein